MQLSNIPGKLVLPFANAGGKSTIPVASQIGITAGAASLTDGFPPLTRTPIAAGGVPPSGLDMNGILYEMSAIIRWANAGGGYPYDSAFATDTNVGGYPKGARVMRSDGTGYWFNTVENNVTDPEAVGAAAAGWVPDYQSGVTSVAMSGSSVTLTPSQYGKPLIVITGTLSANLNLIFPNIVGQWAIINNTSGYYTITAKTSIGVGVAINTICNIVSDGVDIHSELALLADSSGANNIGWIRSEIGAVPTNVGSSLERQIQTVFEFMTDTQIADVLAGTALVDVTVPVQTAINTGKKTRLPAGRYRITQTLTSNGNDFLIFGDDLCVLGEKNNQENNYTGTIIDYYGPDNTHAINPTNSVATNQIALHNLRVIAPKTTTTSIVKIPGTILTGQEYAGGLSLENLAIATRDFDVVSNGINGYISTALEIDCTNGRWFWGQSFKNIYIFGVQTGIIVNVDNGFFNSNEFNCVKMYQVYRSLHLKTTQPTDQIYANLFNGLFVQPNTQLGVFADGNVLIDGNVRQNTFVAPNIFDTSSGQSYKTVNGGVRWSKDNVFITPESNDVLSSGILPGWGFDSRGRALLQLIDMLIGDPSVNPDANVFTFADQSGGWLRYPRNGLTNDIEFGVSNAKKFGIDGATGQKKSIVVGGTSLLQEYGCRAFVHFNGATGTIRSSGNVTSVTRVGIGNYNVVMATPMPDENYTVNASAGYKVGVTDSTYCNVGQYANMTTTTFNIVCKIDGGTYYDPDVVCATVFR